MAQGSGGINANPDEAECREGHCLARNEQTVSPTVTHKKFRQ